MKKFTALLLAAILLLSLAACGKTDAEEPVEEETELTEVNSAEFSEKGTIEETVLYDENNVRITATELGYYYGGFSLELLIENNGDELLNFSSNVLSYSANAVNDCMVSDGYVHCSVDAGKKSMESMDFDYEMLVCMGITEVQTLDVSFIIYDDDNNRIYTGPLHIETSLAGNYGNGHEDYIDTISSKSTEKSMGYELTFIEDKEVKLATGVTLLSKAVMTTDDGDDVVALEFKNSTDKMLAVGEEEIAINGITVSSGTWSADRIISGKRVVAYVSMEEIVDDELSEEYNCDETGSIGMTLTVYDEDYDEVSKTPVTIKLSGRSGAAENEGKEVYSDKYVTVYSLGLTEGESYGLDAICLRLRIENKSSKDLEIDYDGSSSYVNEYMVPTDFDFVDASAGSTVLMTVAIFVDELEEIGIESIDDIKSIGAFMTVEDDDYDTVSEIKLDLSF